MNLILIASEEINEKNIVILQDRRSDHIINILGRGCGDRVRIGLLNGPIGSGRILDLAPGKPGRVALEIAADGPPPPRPQVDLILALPRPIMLKRILAQAVAIGVDRIFLINAGRVEKSFFQASLLKDRNYLPCLHAGLEQAVDTRVPELSIHKGFKAFVEDQLPVIGRQALGLLAHPGGRPLLEMVSPPLTGRIVLAVGPEGGWLDYEIDRFKEQGFIPFSAGPRILRVETAIAVLLGQLSLLRACP